MADSTQLRIAKIFGTLAAGWTSGQTRIPLDLVHITVRPADRTVTGYIASMTVAGIPAVAKAPPNVAPKQWRTIFDIGISTAPKIAFAASFPELPNFLPAAK